MTRTLKLTLITALAFAFAHAGNEESEERGREGGIKRPSPVSVHDGQTILTLQSDAQTRLGLRTASLAASTHRAEEPAAAFVLPVQELGELSTGYTATIARREKARATLDVSRKEYERLKGLYKDNQNASAKALDAAEGTFRSDQAELRAAEQGVTLQRNSVQQRWGAIVADWVAHDSSMLIQLLDQHAFLVQITLPFGSYSQAPRSAALELPSGSITTATFISPFPRIDPRIQRATFLYSIPANSAIAPGMNLSARLARGNSHKGVVVPESAVVWWQGRAWVYRQTGASTFSRQEIATSSPVGGGLFVTEGFSPGDKVVVEGTESLLSAELGSQVLGEQGEEEGR